MNSAEKTTGLLGNLKCSVKSPFRPTVMCPFPIFYEEDTNNTD